jgi:hypothetical protein
MSSTHLTRLLPQSGKGADTLNAVSTLIVRFEIMCRQEAVRLGVDPVAVIDLATLQLFERRIERTLGQPTPPRSP